jgi:hypothetical protein
MTLTQDSVTIDDGVIGGAPAAPPGDPDATTTGPVFTQVRLVDDDGTGGEVLRLDDSLGIVLNSVDLSFPNVRESVDVRTGQDGTTDVSRYVGSRSVTAEITLPDIGYYAVEDALRAAMHPALRYYLYIQRPGWEEERRILVRGATYASAIAQWPKTAQLGWAGITGTLEGAPVQVEIPATFSGLEGGVATPVATPVGFAAGLNPGTSFVTIDGTAPATLRADLYGPCTNPALYIGDSDQVLALNLTIAAGDYIHVDFAARTVTLNSDPNQSRYGSLDFLRSSWWPLPPGPQRISFNPSYASGSSKAVLTWRPRYL